jgi:hypothetical protein
MNRVLLDSWCTNITTATKIKMSCKANRDEGLWIQNDPAFFLYTNFGSNLFFGASRNPHSCYKDYADDYTNTVLGGCLEQDHFD